MGSNPTPSAPHPPLITVEPPLLRTCASAAAVSCCHCVRLAEAWAASCGWLCRIRAQVCRRTSRLLTGRFGQVSVAVVCSRGHRRHRWSHDTSSPVARESGFMPGGPASSNQMMPHVGLGQHRHGPGCPALSRVARIRLRGVLGNSGSGCELAPGDGCHKVVEPQGSREPAVCVDGRALAPALDPADLRLSDA